MIRRSRTENVKVDIRIRDFMKPDSREILSHDLNQDCNVDFTTLGYFH